MAGAGKKTFTAGEVLTASDVNTYLMEQSVMVFGGTAARSSAIPTPSTGMTTYIGVTGTASIPQIETYTGSAWQTPYGLTQVANVSFTSAASIAIDNVFSTTYTNYLFHWRMTAASGTDVELQLRGRIAGVDKTTGLRDTRLQIQNTTLTGTIDNALRIGNTSNTFPAFAVGNFTLFNPNIATATTFSGQSLYTSNAGVDNQFVHGGYCNVAEQWDGAKIVASTGTISGTVRVYGYRNS
jgi:hypothetical protein